MNDLQDQQRKPPQWDNPLKIIERIVVQGKLKLDTPARFGGVKDEAMLDMPLLRDERAGRALLTGASIAGALRDYVRQRELGYGIGESGSSTVAKLFGFRERDDGEHSLLIVNDALGDEKPSTELRDGVAINPKTRTAEENKKFDLELLAAGTTFDVQFELRVIEGEDRAALVGALAAALTGLQNGEIGLGARKRRGLGFSHIEGDWKVARYLMSQPKGLVGWLNDDRSDQKTGTDLFQLLSVSPATNDQRRRFTLEATFELDGSLLIRSGSGDLGSPDFVHLRSGDQPVLSGTSLAGALRGRTLRIVNTLRPNQSNKNWEMVDAMFGVRHTTEEQKKPNDKRRALAASRLIVQETEIKHGVDDQVQSRVAIDRFTGGAYPTALFSEQPVFGTRGTEARIKLELRNPHDYEIGILLLLLKDVWTRDLALGGESSVGRGRLKGKSATLVWQRPNDTLEWTISQSDDNTLIITSETSDQATLEHFVTYCLQQELAGKEAQHDH